jgi:hypothetical protein
MIKLIKGYFFLLKQKKKQKKIQNDLLKAQEHALLALAYWKDCHKIIDVDLLFKLENSNIYVRLGK